MFKRIIFLTLVVGSTQASITTKQNPQHSNFQYSMKGEILQHGKQAYEMRCSGCHGLEGNGKGPASAFLEIKPRDFTSGVYKFRSGPIGTLPSDHDLMEVISKGIPTSSMPEFSDVPEQERFAIIEYIKTFAKDVWEDKSNYANPVQGSPFPREDFEDFNKFAERARSGRQTYLEACAICHGQYGKGNGPSAKDLIDEWGNPVKPASLQKRTIKRGKSVKDIYKTLLVGVNGTPMPAFKDVYSDDKLWDVAAWVLYLRGVKAGYYGDNDDKLPIKMITDEAYQEYTGF